MSDAEEWRPVVGREGEYEVSSLGHVLSLRSGIVLKPNAARGGRLFVCLGRRNQRYIHHLVLEVFVAPRPPAPGNNGLHKNDIVTDNRPENLYWGTYSDNMSDRIANGRHGPSNKTQCMRGHAFTAENTYRTQIGTRGCVQCRRDYGREWMRAKRAAAK